MIRSVEHQILIFKLNQISTIITEEELIEALL